MLRFVSKKRIAMWADRRGARWDNRLAVRPNRWPSFGIVTFLLEMGLAAAALRARLPVVLYGSLTPPRRKRHHQQSAEPGHERLVRSPQLDESCVGVGRTPRPQTDGFELAPQFLELFGRQPID